MYPEVCDRVSITMHGSENTYFHYVL